ncbi:MAG: lipid-transfer protein [Proteobacteria bacterium]|nr:lipid-transfer protein [Pseudomonadota bacterium]HQR03364.1 lipid-transfer protein [Rhodocyclaceae bacterium]
MSLSRNPDRQAAVVGIGQTEFSKASGRSELQLAAECIRSAMADAGIAPAEIDGMVTFSLDNNDEIGLGRCLGIENLNFSSRVPNGGLGSVGTLAHAAAVIESGLCEVVVIWRAMNERSQYRFGQPMVNQAIAPGGGTGFMEWCAPFGAQTPASWIALGAQRYMSTYGVDNEDFGRIAVSQRQYAATNPAAWFHGKPMRLADHQQSRWVAPPVLRLLDCCQESDGGVALVLTRLSRARHLRQPPVRVLAATQSMPFDTEVATNFYHGDLARMVEGEATARRLYALTGLGPQHMQAAMLYDAFTPLVMMQLEAFGFCGPGEGRDFVRDGHLGPGGRLPVNTHGGLLSEAYIHGVNSMAEGVRQVRGSAANPVPGVEHVLLSSCFAGAILGRDQN